MNRKSRTTLKYLGRSWGLKRIKGMKNSKKKIHTKKQPTREQIETLNYINKSFNLSDRQINMIKSNLYKVSKSHYIEILKYCDDNNDNEDFELQNLFSYVNQLISDKKVGDINKKTSLLKSRNFRKLEKIMKRRSKNSTS